MLLSALNSKGGKVVRIFGRLVTRLIMSDQAVDTLLGRWDV